MSKIFYKIRYPNIQTKMIIMFLSIAMIPLMTLNTITSNVFSKYTISILTSNLNYSSEKINNDFKDLLASIDKLTLDIIYNELVQSTLQEHEESYSTKLAVDKYLSMLCTEHIQNIIYIDNKDRIFSANKNERVGKLDIWKSNMYSKLRNTYGKLSWTFAKDVFNPDNDSYYIYAARYVRHLSLDVSPGVLIVRINPNVLNELFVKSETEKLGNYMLSDSSGLVIFDTGDRQNVGKPNADSFLTKLINQNSTGTYVGSTSSGDNLITYNSDNNARWSIIGIMPYSMALGELRYLQRLSLYLTLLFVFIAVAIAIVYSMSYTKPIKRIVSSMRAMRKGNFDVKIQQVGTDEIGELAVNFNKMSTEIQALMKKVEQDQQELKISELNSLIHQINPHFLYNTLDNINMLAKLSQEKRISELITALSKLLRVSLSGGRGIIPVSDEIEHVSNYLLIQKMRYGNLFDFTIDVDEQLRGKEVMKLILQPLAENAISHGFKNICSNGFITVSAYVQEDNMVFEVSDNGSGIPEDKLQKLNSPNMEGPQDEKIQSKGYGIKNLNIRLRLFYGSSCHVIFDSSHGGVTSKITIPMTVS